MHTCACEVLLDSLCICEPFHPLVPSMHGWPTGIFEIDLEYERHATDTKTVSDVRVILKGKWQNMKWTALGPAAALQTGAPESNATRTSTPRNLMV